VAPEPGQREGSFGRRLRRYLIAGLLVWLPIVVTIFILRFLVGLVNGVLPELRIENTIGFPIPGLELALAILVLLLTGLAVTNLVGREIVGWWESVLKRIPVVRSIYSGAKTFTETVFTDKGKAFKRVLLVQYPRQGVWSIGLQSGESLGEASERTGRELIPVFVPTTPNPTSGFIIMVPREEAIPLDMTVDQAMRFIFTLGVVAPDWPPGPGAAPGAAPPPSGLPPAPPPA
jgi:uncharacterized membrane protein